MSTALHPARAPRPRARVFVPGGVHATCLVGSLALMGAGHGIAGWGLMMASAIVLTLAQLRLRASDVVRRGSWLATAGVMAALLALIAAGGLTARAVAVDHPWFATLVAVAAGVGTGALQWWWHRRPALRTT